MTTKAKIITYTQAGSIASKLRRQGKKIVFKTGCFDIFHIAHARALAYSKSLGDVLFVGIGSDITLRKLKGEARPVFPATYRAEVIAALGCVDYAVILKEPIKGRIDHERIISIIRPHYYMLPPDDKALQAKKEMAKKYGVKIRLKKQMKSAYTGKIISSTAIYHRLNKLH